MKKRISFIVGYLLSIFLYTSLACGATAIHEPTITPLWTWQLSCDFGPRIVPTAGASWFHRGIDYPTAAGTGINPVEYNGIVAAFVKNQISAII
jgi:hypothetical protein